MPTVPDEKSAQPAGDIKLVDAAIDAAITELAAPKRLAEAMRYAALGPGKRVRPRLCLDCCRAVSGGVLPDCDDVFRAAAALEMVHAFSLVHDDLPAMDDDDTRRGRPTVHKAFDEATAILAGDALQGLALESLTTIAQPWATEAVRVLAAGTNEMIAGQVLDTLGGDESDAQTDPKQALGRVHRLKTGALLRAAAEIGALAGGADNTARSELATFGLTLGLMFQAVDDLLDVTSDEATLGKATQKDAEAGKLTYPAVFGVEGTRREIRQLHDAALLALNGFGPAASPLREMAEALATRQR